MGMERMRRVVVTGLGMVSPMASGVEATWRRLLASKSGAGRVENFDVSDLPCQIAAQVPRGNLPDAFNPDDWMEPKEQRRVDDFIIFGMSARRRRRCATPNGRPGPMRKRSRPAS